MKTAVRVARDDGIGEESSAAYSTHRPAPVGWQARERHQREAYVMKVIITGSRGIADYSLVETAIRLSGLEGRISQVALRGTSGIARLGEQYADAHVIPVGRFARHWNRGGRHDSRAELQ